MRHLVGICRTQNDEALPDFGLVHFRDIQHATLLSLGCGPPQIYAKESIRMSNYLSAVVGLPLTCLQTFNILHFTIINKQYNSTYPDAGYRIGLALRVICREFYKIKLLWN
jgi:hypothetical protein